MPTSPPLQSTRLENLGFESDGARFELEGRPIRIKKDIDPASVAALRGFYQSALADLQFGPSQQKPGLFSRIRAWFGRLFSPGGATQPESLPAPHSPPPAAPPQPRRTPREAEVPAPLVAAPGARMGEPILRAVFADEGGVHLHWQKPAARGSLEQVERHYELDSELAQRLQTCYGHLDRLGYKVVGLDLLRTAERKVEKDVAPEAGKGAAVPEKAPEKKEPIFVMRLHPEATDQPDRALVSPVENSDNLQVLVAPERLLKALRAGADSAKPEGERVTYLRCTAGKAGLKVVDVGLGEGKDHSPERWEEVSKWLPAAEPSGAKRAKAAPAPAAPPTGEPELNL